MFMDEQFSRHTGPASHDDRWMESLMDTMIVRAVRDAQQSHDLTLQQEARAWLWICCPDLADQLDLPSPAPACEIAGKAPGEVAAYAQRQRPI